MELPLRGGASSNDRMVRVKVCFEDDRSLLTPHQILNGLSASWFVVRPDLRTIADLVADIALSFSLTCPHDIFLQMEDFTLPPSQPISLLKEKDIVIVKKKSSRSFWTTKTGNCSSLGESDTFDRKGTVGVTPSVIEEFEKEIGGYESEEEEDGGETPTETLEAKNTTKAKKKKRQKKEIEGVNGQEMELRLQEVPFTRHGTANEKKPKRKRPAMELARQENRELSTRKPHKPKKDKKVKEESLSSGEIYGGHKKKRKVLLKKKSSYEGDEMNVDSTALGINKPPCSNGEKTKLEVEHIGLESAARLKKPSRSTLRKKAKRRWKSEQQKALATQMEIPSKGLAFSDELKLRPFSFQTRNEDDGEAEEEKLPTVVRPGHIRFEHSDEGDGNDKNVNAAVPIFAWSNGMSKRKGQSWGQEKAYAGKNEKSNPEDCLMEACNPPEVDFDTLPALNSMPQEGDVVAYRLVELAPSKCPELSEYRVGKVADIKSQMGMLKLVEDPDYPIERSREDQDPERNYDGAPLFPYNEDGSLEIQWASLVDVRLVKGDLCDKREASEYTSKENLESTLGEVLVPILQSTPEPPSSDANHHKDQPQGVITNSAWHELAAVLEKKREELSKGGSIGPISTEEENKEPCLEELKRSIEDSGAEKSTLKVKNGRSKSWLRKAGGLGSTVALLRTQNTV